MNTQTTHHADIRCQQRSIPPFVVQLVLDYGCRRHQRDAELVFLDKSGRKKLKRELGPKILARIEDQLDIYIVEKEGLILTVGHRLKKIGA